MPLRAGDTIDRFSIEALLGEGGMGEVYRAHDPRLQRKVALKVVRMSDAAPGTSSGSSDGTARILREARAAGALDHPNAVAIFDVGETDGIAWLAMELIEGSPLRAFVGDVTIPMARRIRWLADVARALAAAHRRGLVHRDVKPENVMVRDDGVVKVLDFGIARRTSAPIDATAATTPEGLPTITQEGTVVGTPLYMSPEQLKGEPLDGRADQFAWGVMAYELIAGFTPWRDALAPRAERHAFRLVAAILSDDPAPLASVSDVQIEIADVIHRALAKRVPMRFDSMDDVVAALEPFLTGRIEGASARTRLPSPSRAPQPVRTDMSASGSLAPTEEVPAQAPRRWIPIAAFAVAGALALGAWSTRSRPTPAAAIPASATLSAATDVPMPVSANADAVSAYRAGMQAFRDGLSDVWASELMRAVQLDPSLAAAHVRLAWILQGSSSSAARDHFAKASLLRGALSPHDQALLEAGVPFFQAAKPDHAEVERRIRDASARFPADAELVFFLANAHADRGDFAGAREAMTHAIDADPKFAMAWGFRAVFEAYLDDTDGAQRSLASCLEAVPSASLCLHFRAQLDEKSGACARVEADARRMIAIAPQGAAGYGFLAEALYAQGQGLDATRATLRQEIDRHPEAARREAELTAARKLAELGGDFTAAEESALALEKIVAGRDDDGVHATIAAALVGIYDESGRTKRAGEVARDYLARRPAWIGNPRAEDYALAADVVPAMLAAEARAGIIDGATFEAKRTEWVARWESVLPTAYLHTLWIQGIASIARTPTQATNALALLPRFGPPHGFSPLKLDAADRGRVSFLAGRVDESIAPLASAARSCVALSEPIAHTRAVATLAAALDAKGDKPAACAAYAIVLDRWGKARPQSVTADAARRRVTALQCR